MSTKTLRTSSTRSTIPDQLIVARDHAGVCLALRDIAAPGNFTVVLDRRKVERRQRVQPVLEERRHGERRSRPPLVENLRQGTYVVVPPSHR